MSLPRIAYPSRSEIAAGQQDTGQQDCSERERELERASERDRNTDGETERQRDRQTDRERERERERETHTQTGAKHIIPRGGGEAEKRARGGGWEVSGVWAGGEGGAHRACVHVDGLGGRSRGGAGQRASDRVLLPS
eukprot:1982984-Rhodomonas_salina.1